MCKNTPPKKLHNVFKLISFICFGVFGVIGACFYIDYMAHEQYDCSDTDSLFNRTTTPDCYSHHFFGFGWITMAIGVPVFAVIGYCRRKVTIIGAVIAFIAGSFGIYFVVMVFVDDDPYSFQNAQEPRYQLGHGFVLIGEGIRSGCELLGMFINKGEKPESDVTTVMAESPTTVSRVVKH